MDEAAANVLEVLHRVPGRVRVAVRPVEAALLEHLVVQALRIVGVVAAEVGASRRNVVVRFNPNRVTEDNVMMRLGLSLSARCGYEPVQVVHQRQGPGLDRGAMITGGLAGAAALLTAARPLGPTTALVGWAAALLTIATVGRRVASDLARGKPRAEGLSLLHLLSRLGSQDRGFGALLTWLLFNGKDVAEQLRGGAGKAVELRPVMLTSGVGEDQEGTHMEIVTRPVQARGALEGNLLTPSTLATAAIGYLAYSLKQGWVDRSSASN